jgi:hypothetical protein
MPGDVRLIRTPASVVGMVLTTISAVLFLVVFLADLFGLHTNPYLGIVFFLVLPAVFVIGLALIPFGAWLERRRRARGKAPSSLSWPKIDFNDPAQRTTAVIAFLLTMANIVIVSLAAYRGVEYMDSVEFCGQACHTVMRPEFVAHAAEPHARVKCVECHVGSGASSFAKAKLAGTRRVAAVALKTYSRPIKAAADQLVAATETCERCHRPEQSHGDKVHRVVEYANDEKNSESVTTLRLHVGGGDARRGMATGIHWHTNADNAIEYVATDPDRQTIPYVRLRNRAGALREFVAEGVSPDVPAGAAWRRMECADCHNRPSHSMAATPERAVDAAIAQGDIPVTLPFVRREAVKLLKASYDSQDRGAREISQALTEFYRARSSPGDGAATGEVGRAANAVQEIYRRNVFPDMNVTFGTYPNNIGHVDAPGCFRCHDDNHKSKDGRKIGQDCETCHAIE